MTNSNEVNNIIIKSFKVQGLDLIITMPDGKVERIENGLSEIILGNLILSTEKGVPLSQDEILSSIHMSVGADAVYIKEQFTSDIIDVADNQKIDIDDEKQLDHNLIELEKENQALSEALRELTEINEQKDEQLNSSVTKLNQVKQQMNQVKSEKGAEEKNNEMPPLPALVVPPVTSVSSSSSSASAEQPKEKLNELPVIAITKSQLFIQGGLSAKSDSSKVGDNITQVSTPIFTGVISLDAVGYLLLDGQKYPITPDLKGNWSLDIKTPLKEGKHQYELVASRDATDTTTVSGELIIDTQLDNLNSGIDLNSDSGVAGDGITNNPLPTLTGLAEAGSQVTLTLGQQTLSTVVDQQGIWRIGVKDALPEGTSAYQVTAVDAAGNTKTETGSVTVKTRSPNLTLLLEGKADFKTNHATPTFSGKTESDVDVRVKIDNQDYAVKADKDGNWSLPMVDKLADGMHVIGLSVTDIAGNISTVTQSVLIDTVIPSSHAQLALESDSGIEGDSLTQKKAVTLVGVTKPDAKINVTFDGKTYPATANPMGEWQVPLPAVSSDGAFDYHVNVVDHVGNIGTSSGQFTVDTSMHLDAGLDSASQSPLKTDGKTTHLLRPQISGTADPQSIITATFKGTVKKVNADAQGKWSLAFDTNASVGKDNQYVITAEDAAGNTKTLNQVFTFILQSEGKEDLTAPKLSVMLDADSDSGKINDGITNVKKPKFIGVATENSDISLVIAGNTYTAKADASTGKWSLTTDTLQEGTNSYTVTATRPDNGMSSSVQGNLFIDTTAAVSTVALTEDTDSGIKGNFITNHRTPVFTGQSDPNIEIKLTLNNEAVSTTTDKDGKWSLKLTKQLPENFTGEYVISTTDTADNKFEKKGSLVVDNLKPELSEIKLVSPWKKGKFHGDQSTNDLTPDFEGKASVGANLVFSFTLTDYAGSKKFSYPITDIDQNGNWSFSPPKGLLVKDHRYSMNEIFVKAVSPAGNESIKDFYKPGVQIKESVLTVKGEVAAESSSTGINDQYLSASRSPKLQGTIDGSSDRDELQGYIDISGNRYPLSFANSRKNWSVELPQDVQLPLGENNYTLTLNDVYGSEYKFSSYIVVSDFKFSLTPETDTNRLGDNITSHKKPVYKGKAAIGANVSAKINGEIYPIKVNSKGEWQFEVPSKGEGIYDITFVHDLDRMISGKITLNIDTTPPEYENNWIHWDDVHPKTNISKTNDLRFYSVYKGMIDSTIVSVNGQTYTFNTDFDSNRSDISQFGGKIYLPNGEYLAQITAIDIAGNKTEHEITMNVLGGDQGKNPPQIAAGFHEQLLVSTKDSKIEFNESMLKLMGTTTPASWVEIKDAQGKLLGKEKANNNGKWEVLLPIDDIPVGIKQDDSIKLMISAKDMLDRESHLDVNLVYSNTPPELTGGLDNVLIVDKQQVNIKTPSFSGTTEAYAKVTLAINSKSYAVTADKNGKWLFKLSDSDALNDGNYSYRIEAKSVIGLESTQHIENNLIVKTTPKLAGGLDFSSDSGVLDDEITKVSTPKLSGVTEANATVRVTFDNKMADAYEIKADNQGVWQIEVSKALAEGKHDYVISVDDKNQDIRGNITGQLIIDTIAPDTLTAGVTDTPNSTIQNNLLTKINTPTFSGRSEPLAQILLTIDASTHVASIQKKIVADDQGRWTFTLPSSNALSDGQYVYRAMVEDTAGNPSGIELIGFITVDTTAPILKGELDAASDTGIAGDNLTNINTPTFSGGAEAKSTVFLSINGKAYSAIADEAGHWSVSIPASDKLADGQHAYTIDVMDAAGNQTQQAGSITVDTSAPALHGALDAASDTGIVGDHLTNINTPTFSGGAEAKSTVFLSINGKAYSAIADEAGHWRVSIPTSDKLSDGQHAYTIDVMDAAGNQTQQAGSITVDTSAPALHGALDAASDTGIVGDHLTNINTPTFSGGAEAKSTVFLSINGKAYSAIADEAGHWSVSIPASDKLSDGQHAYTIDVMDAAGNQTQQAGSITVDTSAPALHGALDAASDTGIVGDHLTNINTPTFSGGAEAKSTVFLSINGKAYSAIADEAGHWSVSIPTSDKLADGQHAYTIDVMDAAGNQTQQAGNITIDTQQPHLDGQLDDASNSGELSDTLTNVATPTFSGTVKVGSVVTLTINNVTYPAQVDNAGKWALALPAGDALPDGSYLYTVEATDIAGNTQQFSNSITVDTLAPSAAGELSTGSDSGIPNDNITNIATPTFSGKTESKAKVTLNINGKDYNDVADASGEWRISIPTSDKLSDGQHAYTIEVMDAAGNQAQEAGSITIDTQAPTYIEAHLNAELRVDMGSLNTTVTFGGKAEPESTITVFIENKPYGHTQVDKNGSWELKLENFADEGDFQYTVESKDIAGNTHKIEGVMSVSNPVVPVDGSISTTLIIHTPDASHFDLDNDYHF